jgi:hypothetical protein
VQNRRIVPVDIGARHQLDIWLTYHPDVRRSKRKAFFIDWLRSIFAFSTERPEWSVRYTVEERSRYSPIASTTRVFCSLVMISQNSTTAVSD